MDMKFKGWMQVGGILTVHTPDRAEPQGLRGLKVKQSLPDKFLCTRGEMDRRSLPKIGNWDIRVSEDQACLYRRDFGTQGRGYFPTGRGHAPPKGMGS